MFFAKKGIKLRKTNVFVKDAEITWICESDAFGLVQRLGIVIKDPLLPIITRSIMGNNG